MTAELKDLRAKVTLETWAALKAESQVSGRDQSEIVRAVLHQWATERMRAATLLNATLVSEGLPGIAAALNPRGHDR